MNKISERYREDHMGLRRQGKKPRRLGLPHLVKQRLRKDTIHGPLLLLLEKEVNNENFIVIPCD